MPLDQTGCCSTQPLISCSGTFFIHEIIDREITFSFFHNLCRANVSCDYKWAELFVLIRCDLHTQADRQIGSNGSGLRLCLRACVCVSWRFSLTLSCLPACLLCQSVCLSLCLSLFLPACLTILSVLCLWSTRSFAWP